MNDPNENRREMPTYRSHKVVHALKLERISKLIVREGRALSPVDKQFAVIQVHADEALFDRLPKTFDDPGYLVHYADGFKSWSPTKAFEEGYSACEVE